MERQNKKIWHYTTERLLGTGQFAKVYLATSDHDQKKYAIKCITKSVMAHLQRLLKNEVNIMNTINHPNIMHLYEFLESSNHYYLVIDYCNKGDLEHYLSLQPNHFLPENDALYFLKQIMNAFQVLHKHKVMHRDFKLANIFLHDDTVVIGDFGFAKSGFEMAQTRLGTPVTMAPEVHIGVADLWSIGMVFYHLLYGEYPFYGLSVPELMADIREKSGNNLQFPDHKNKVSEPVKDLLRGMLQMEPKDRIDWDVFFKSPVFEKDVHPGFMNAIKDIAQKIHTKEVDQEFEKNRKTLTPDCNDTTLLDPLNQDGGLSVNVEQISDTISTIASSTLPQEYKEYSFRYYHEKNKILVIYLTVKKLRQLMKEPDFKEHKVTLYLLITVLAKKGAELSELTILSLTQANNIFKLEHFDSYCQNTPEYHETLEQLTSDKQLVSDYQKYIVGLKGEISLNEEQLKIFNMCTQDFVELRVLDDTARSLYNKVRQLGIPENFIKKPQSRHLYLITMIFTIYSIKTEIYLPYMSEGSKFEWDTFKQKHEDLNCDSLQQHLVKLEAK